MIYFAMKKMIPSLIIFRSANFDRLKNKGRRNYKSDYKPQGRCKNANSWVNAMNVGGVVTRP